MHAPFSIEESLRFGWAKTRGHSAVLFPALLVIIAIQLLYSAASTVLGPSSVVGLTTMVVLAVLGIVAGLGYARLTLLLAQGHRATLRDMMLPMHLVWHYAAASVLVVLMVVLGFIALIIPGVYLLVRFSMLRFLVLEGKGIMGSIRHSGPITEGVKWRLLGFFLVVAVLKALGALLFLVGLLITVPITMVAYAHVYEKLKARAGKKA